jgi:hypothetical protein
MGIHDGKGEISNTILFKTARNSRITECLRLIPKSASGGLLKHSIVRRHFSERNMRMNQLPPAFIIPFPRYQRGVRDWAADALVT